MVNSALNSLEVFLVENVVHHQKGDDESSRNQNVEPVAARAPKLRRKDEKNENEQTFAGLNDDLLFGDGIAPN